MQSQKRGFTLIELLVVVLIVGILTAVALPQYQQAVLKSQFAKLRVMTESITKSVHVYYLAQGDWPKDFEDLDITLPVDMTSGSITNGTCRYNEQFYCCVMYPHTITVDGSIICGLSDESLAYQRFYVAENGNEKKSANCVQKLNTNNVCSRLPGAIKLSSDTSFLFTPHGAQAGYERYQIE